MSWVQYYSLPPPDPFIVAIKTIRKWTDGKLRLFIDEIDRLVLSCWGAGGDSEPGSRSTLVEIYAVVEATPARRPMRIWVGVCIFLSHVHFY